MSALREELLDFRYFRSGKLKAELDTVSHTQFFVHGLNVILDSLTAKVKELGNLPIGKSGRNECR